MNDKKQSNMESKGKNIPKLRFPGFEGEWEVKKLGEISTFIVNNTFSRSELNYEKGDVINIHYGDVLIKFGSILDCSKELLPYITDNGKAKKASHNKLAEGDIVFADTAEDETVGKCTEILNVNGKCIVSGLHTIAVHPTISFSKGYLGHYLNSISYRNQLFKLMQGVKVTSISKSALSSTHLIFPTLPEQQKIASCLSSLDGQISAEQSRLESLSQHKRGLMQQLFPQEGETVPKLRFPGFEGEWEVKKLGEIASKSTKRNTNLSIKRVLTNSATLGVIDQTDYFDKDIAVKENTENYHIIEKDEFVYNPRISVFAPVGPISRNKIGQGIMSPLYTIFRIKNENINFIEHYFSTSIWHPYLRSVANNGARFDRMNITTNDFFNMPLLFPSIPEQQKIASCLTAIDKLIAAQQERIEALKQHKRGLMQQLFPAVANE